MASNVQQALDASLNSPVLPQRKTKTETKTDSQKLKRMGSPSPSATFQQYRPLAEVRDPLRGRDASYLAPPPRSVRALQVKHRPMKFDGESFANELKMSIRSARQRGA